MASSNDLNSSLAVLIDADNANPAIVEGLLEEVAKLGIASVKRIYGDWTTPNLGQWKQVLLEHSIQLIRQFRYTTGKNATDSAMIIDAGWAQLGPVGNFISKTANDFDPRNYGFAKLNELISAVGLFEVERRETRIFVRNNRKKMTS